MDTKIIAQRLKTCRLQKGYTLSQVATYLNISKSLLSNYENAQNYPGIRSLIALANFYHVTTDYLLGIECLTLPKNCQFLPVYDRHHHLLEQRVAQTAYKDSFYYKEGTCYYLIVRIRSLHVGRQVLFSYQHYWQLGTIVHHAKDFFVQTDDVKKTGLLSVKQLKDDLLGIVSETTQIL